MDAWPHTANGQERLARWRGGDAYLRLGCLPVGSSPRWFPTRKSQGIAYLSVHAPVAVEIPWPGQYLIALFDAGHKPLSVPLCSPQLKPQSQSVVMSMGSETPNAEYKG